MLPVGNPAIGDDFIDREKEIEQILSTLDKDHILLIAPRRFGKTSVMRRLEKELLSKGLCVFLEVEDVYYPQQFIAEIVMELIENERVEKKIKVVHIFKEIFHWFKDNIDELETPIFKAKLKSNIQDDLKDDWMKKAKQISDIISSVESNIYFIFDEFPVAIKNMNKVNIEESEKFMHWFRKFRQISIKANKIRFIVGGSVSIDRVIREVGGPAIINDFKRVKIEGFEKEVTTEVIKKVFDEEQWHYKPSYGEKILECLGDKYIPYFIAIILSTIKEEKILKNKEINEQLIEDVYNNYILGSEGKHYFDPYSHRLRIFYSEMEERAARAILKRVCNVDYYPTDHAFSIYVEETGLDDHEKFMDSVADLSNDFYLEHDPKHGLRFYSKMLKDWWRLYHGTF